MADWFTPEHIAAEWKVLTAAPVLTIGLVLAMLGIGYLAARWRYERTIEHLNARLQLRDDQLAARSQLPTPTVSPPALNPQDSAKALAAPPQPSGTAERRFVPAAFAARLVEFERSRHTEAQYDALLRPHAGQWVRLTGRLFSCSTYSDMALVSLVGADNEAGPTIAFGPEWFDHLGNIGRGDQITADAQIDMGAGARLKRGELI